MLPFQFHIAEWEPPVRGGAGAGPRAAGARGTPRAKPPPPLLLLLLLLLRARRRRPPPLLERAAGRAAARWKGRVGNGTSMGAGLRTSVAEGLPRRARRAHAASRPAPRCAEAGRAGQAAVRRAWGDRDERERRAAPAPPAHRLAQGPPPGRRPSRKREKPARRHAAALQPPARPGDAARRLRCPRAARGRRCLHAEPRPAAAPRRGSARERHAPGEREEPPGPSGGCAPRGPQEEAEPSAWRLPRQGRLRGPPRCGAPTAVRGGPTDRSQGRCPAFDRAPLGAGPRRGGCANRRRTLCLLPPTTHLLPTDDERRQQQQQQQQQQRPHHPSGHKKVAAVATTSPTAAATAATAAASLEPGCGGGPARDCGRHGKCVHGACLCTVGYTGEVRRRPPCTLAALRLGSTLPKPRRADARARACLGARSARRQGCCGR
eukprot:scaffold1259_cov368-Prasinococcus_capsulatus_cf.AAC.1